MPAPTLPVLAARRLATQRLEGEPLDGAAAVVRHLGAVQAQDVPAARWSIGQRATGLDEAAVDAALASGEVVRTHVLRDTWHLVAREDVRWLLALTAPRILARNATMHRREGLDDAELARGTDAIAAALRDGRQRTRPELAHAMAEAGVPDPSGFRLTYLVMHAELTAVIASGAPRGRQQTYALLDEHAPDDAPLPSRSEALERLARRYLAGHGPAAAEDVARWASLTLADARTAVRAVAEPFALADGRELWDLPGARATEGPPPTRAHLLQGWDEYVNGFLATRDVCDPDGLLQPEAPGAFVHRVVHAGQVVARWRRGRVTARKLVVELQWLRDPTRARRAAVEDAAARYGDFAGRRVSITSV